MSVNTLMDGHADQRAEYVQSIPEAQVQNRAFGRGFDLNLLVIFEAVMLEKNLTRAGLQLGMSQPSVSHALARMRGALKDQLVVRMPDGMRATPRAERMLGPVRSALQQLRATLDSDDFDASNSSREFTIAANDYAAHTIVPALVYQVARLAPFVVLNVRPTGPQDVFDQLDAGVVELALGSVTEGAHRFKCTGVLEDEYVVVLPIDHPDSAPTQISVERFSALPHVSITSTGDTNFVDDALSEYGLARRVCVRVPLTSLVSVLNHSQGLAVIPRRIAVDLAADNPLTIRPLPVLSPRIKVSMIWHERLDRHFANRWLRAALRSAAVGVRSREHLGASRRGSAAISQSEELA
jgi:DNA-binding transcriptional LysR family regulator